MTYESRFSYSLWILSLLQWMGVVTIAYDFYFGRPWKGFYIVTYQKALLHKVFENKGLTLEAYPHNHIYLLRLTSS